MIDWTCNATPVPSAVEHEIEDTGNPDAFDAGQRERLYGNIAAAMQGVPKEILDRQLAHFREVDPEYGEGVEKALVEAS